MKKSYNYKIWSIISGIIFLLILLAVFIFIPCPTPSQKFFFRILIALSAAAFASTIAGTIEFNNKLISAGGPIAIFVLIYFLNPAGWKDSDCDLRNMKATVYVDGKLTKDVIITIPDIGQKFETDEFGNANIEFSNSQIHYPTSIIFKYKSEVDSTITVENNLETKMIFRLKSNQKVKAQISDNGINFLYKDININLSLFDQSKKVDPENMDYSSDSESVKYLFREEYDTIYIYPSSKLLDEIRNHKIITGKSVYEGGNIDYFQVYFPQFDIKITNNSNDAIFFDQFNLNIIKSTPDNSPVLVPSIMDRFTLHNVGWGTAKNLKIQFSTIPGGETPDWNDKFETTISAPQLIPGGSLDLDRIFINNLIKKNVDSRFFIKNQIKYSEFYDNPKVLKIATNKTPKFVNNGANVFGVIDYLDDHNKPQQIRFSTLIDVFREGYGAGFEFTAKYTTEFKTLGKDYQLKVPISNAIKPKDFDRIALLLAAPQSSVHTFKIALMYQNNKLELPYIFKLDLFNSIGNRENMKKVKM